MSHDEMIAVIEHHKNGGDLECTAKTNGVKWAKPIHEGFDFTSFIYRIKPEPRSLWISFNDRGKPMLAAESAEQAEILARMSDGKFHLFKEASRD
jgi:hypothetical protein